MPDAQLKLTCKSCGGDVAYSATDQAPKCPFCDNVTEIAKPESPASDGPSLIIPLSVELSGLTDAVYEHLASGDLTPDHLLEHADFVKKDRFYVPAYDFDGEYTAHWTATFGFDRQEHYVAYETRTQDGASRQVAVNKTRTVTDWRSETGMDSGEFSVRSYSGRRLVEAGAATLVEDMPGAEHAPFDPSYTVGIDVEPVAASSTEAFTSRATPRINRIIDKSVRQHAQGDHQKDWVWKGRITKRSTALLVPVCHAIYEFEGNQYNVWVSGNDTSRMVADPLPVDKRRKLAINLGFIPVLLSIGAAALAIFEFNSAWRPALTIIPAAAAYGVLRRTSIISYSRGIRKALLARRRAASSNTAQMNAEEQAALNASVKQPSKPWIANSALDKFLLPVMALLATAVPFAGTIHLPHKGTDSGPAAPVAVSAADHVPRPPAPIRIAVQPLPVPAPEAPASAVPTEIPVSSEQAAVANSTTMESPVQSTSEPAEPAAPPVPPAAPLAQVATPPLAGVILQMLQFARANDWSAVDAMAVTSAASAGNLPGADLNTARTQNDAGTAAFHRNDMQAAVAAFRLAAAANPSDPQILDNLAFALIRSGRSEEAVPLLNQILNRSPARATAWGNLSVAVLPDAAASTAALKLAFHFNQNRQRITSYFTPLATSYPDERYRTVVRSVLANADTIPIRPPSRQ